MGKKKSVDIVVAIPMHSVKTGYKPGMENHAIACLALAGNLSNRLTACFRQTRVLVAPLMDEPVTVNVSAPDAVFEMVAKVVETYFREMVSNPKFTKEVSENAVREVREQQAS